MCVLGFPGEVQCEVLTVFGIVKTADECGSWFSGSLRVGPASNHGWACEARQARHIPGEWVGEPGECCRRLPWERLPGGLQGGFTHFVAVTELWTQCWREVGHDTMTHATTNAPPCLCTMAFPRGRRGVANRDLKLENLLLDHDGTSRPLRKICDFGYSKVGLV